MSYLIELFDFPVLMQSVAVKRFAILLVYILSAKLADLISNRSICRFSDHERFDLYNYIFELISGPVYWTIVCLGFLHAIVIEPIAQPWQQVLPNMAKSVILFVWTIAVFKTLRIKFNKKTFEMVVRKDISTDTFNILKKLFRVAIIGIAGLWALTLWGVDLTPVFASAGIAGIAVAMAAKDTLANFFGGVSIFMDNAFKEGDYIVLDSGERGAVVEIGIRSTRIKTRDDILITVPNSILANTKIINESAPVPLFRIRVPVGVAYGSDPDFIEGRLLAIAFANDQIISEPVPRVRFRAFGNSSIDFELLCWVKDPASKGVVIHLLLKEIYKDFQVNGITIPFPQMDVYLKNS